MLMIKRTCKYFKVLIFKLTLHQIYNLSCISFANQYSDYYCILKKLLWKNAALGDRLYICNFVNQVGFVKVMANLGFWFSRKSSTGCNNNRMCNMFRTISVCFLGFSFILRFGCM